MPRRHQLARSSPVLGHRRQGFVPVSSRRTASAFSASLNGNEAIISNAAAKPVVGSVAGIGTDVLGFDLRAFRPASSAGFADTFSVEPVQGMVQGFAGPCELTLICRGSQGIACAFGTQRPQVQILSSRLDETESPSAYPEGAQSKGFLVWLTRVVPSSRKFKQTISRIWRLAV